MKYVLLIFVLILVAVNSHSQEKDSVNLKERPTLLDIQRNSVYIGTHFLTIDAFYERIIPLKAKFGLLAGGGVLQEIGFSTGTNPVVILGDLLGNKKHSFENGLIISPLGDTKLIPYVGYRYQRPKGFLFRADIAFVIGWGTYKDGSGTWFDFNLAPGIAFGYSF